MFYLIVFFILVVLSLLNLQYTDRLSRQMLMPLTAIILICIAGLRYETGGDWNTYTLIFDKAHTLSQILEKPSLLFSKSIEEGFVMLCAVVKNICPDIQALFFTITCINIMLIAKVLPQYTKYPVIALLCYYCLLYFHLEMVYIRQATAVALCFYALQFVRDRRFIKYLFFVLLACTFHRMAVMMIPLYFLLGRRFPVWAYVTIVGVGAVVMAIGVPWITPVFLKLSSFLGDAYADKAEFYTQKGVFSADRVMGMGFYLYLLLFGILMMYKKNIDERPHGTVHLNMLTLSLILYYYGYELVEVSNRTRFFFMISLIVIFPLLIETRRIFLDKLLVFAFVCLYCFSISMNIFLEQPTAIAYNPYQNYIEYKLHPRPSTGKQRKHQADKLFEQQRKK